MLRLHFRQHSDDGITGLGAPTEAFFDFSSVIVSIPPSFRSSHIISMLVYVSPLSISLLIMVRIWNKVVSMILIDTRVQDYYALCSAAQRLG